MTKKIGGGKSKVIPITMAKSALLPEEQKLRLAYEKFGQAINADGKKRTKLAKEAIAFSELCADAYLLLASESEDREESIALCKQGVEAAETIIGKDWEQKFKGVCWTAEETRPVMRALAQLAITHYEVGEDEEALQLFQRLIEANPNDNQGIRFFLATCLFSTKRDAELDKLFAQYESDVEAGFLYTKTLHLFRSKKQAEAEKALLKAYENNVFVPMFLSDVFEMPEEPPSRIQIGGETEAVAYVMDHGFIWFETEGATTWLANTLEPKLNEEIEDKEALAAVLEALRDESALELLKK